MKRKRLPIQRRVSLVFLVSVLVIVMGLGLFGGLASAQCPDDDEFTSEFRLQDCTFKTRGENPYWILEPGYQLVLEGEEEGLWLKSRIF